MLVWHWICIKDSCARGWRLVLCKMRSVCSLTPWGLFILIFDMKGRMAEKRQAASRAVGAATGTAARVRFVLWCLEGPLLSDGGLCKGGRGQDLELKV